MEIIQKLKDWIGLRGQIRDAKHDYGENAAEERRAENRRRRAERRDDERVKLYTLTYDETHNEYKLDLKTQVRRADVPRDAVHVTRQKRTLLSTDLWDELTWPGKGQSAIHMYLWIINNAITSEVLTTQKKGTDLDWKKILFYGVIVVAIIIIAPTFLHR